MSGIKMKRKVVMTITADDTNADGFKVKFECSPTPAGWGLTGGSRPPAPPC